MSAYEINTLLIFQKQYLNTVASGSDYTKNVFARLKRIRALHDKKSCRKKFKWCVCNMK